MANQPVIIKNTREEIREGLNGRIYERAYTTWDVVDGTGLLGAFDRKKDAVAFLARQGAK